MNTKSILNIKKPVLYSWLISYIFILIIPLFLGAYVYIEAIGIIRYEIDRAHTSSLKQIKTLVDGRIQDIERIYTEIALNDKVNSIMYLDTEPQPFHRYTMTEILRDFRKFTVSNELIEGIFIYFADSNFIISNNGAYNASDIDFVNKQYFKLDENQWTDLINSSHIREYKTIKYKDVNGTEMNKIAFIQSLPIINKSKPKATLIILINEQKLAPSFQQLKWLSKGFVTVIDTNDNMLFLDKAADNVTWSIQYEFIKDSQEYFDFNLSGSDVAITHIASEVNDWQYVSFIPTDVFLEKIKHIKSITLFYVVICMITGGVIAYLFSRRNYNPVRKIVGLFSNSAEDAGLHISNEYKLIENSIINLIKEKESINNRLKQQNEVMRNNFLARLIKGRIKDNNIMVTCELYGISFKSEDFLIMLFCIDDLSNIFFEKNDGVDEETINLANFIVCNITEELINENDLGYMIEIDGMLACLINIVHTDLKAVKNNMIELARKIKTIIENKFDIGFTVAISNVHKCTLGLSKAYEEALEVIEYKMLLEDNNIMHYDDINPQNRNGFNVDYSLERQQQFINCIKAEDYKSAMHLMNEIVDKDFLQNTYSLQIIKCRMFSLINFMINTIGEIMSECYIDFFEELDPVNKLLNCKSISDLRKQMNEIFLKVNEFHMNREKENEGGRINEILGFIEENYMQPDLSISLVAMKFKLSTSYLSKLIKKHKGVRYIDYVHKLRLDKAKNLMKEFDLNIKQIAEMTGYYNDVAMIRAFKRYEGITPGKFKDLGSPDDSTGPDDNK